MGWALVINSCRLIARQKISLPFVMILAIALPLASRFMFVGDATLPGALRMMWSWQFYTSSLLLMLITVYLAVSSLADETREMQLVLVLVKPVPRWLVLLSKFLAVGLVSGALVIVCAASSYLALRWRLSPGSVIELRSHSTQTLRYTVDQRFADASEQRLLADQEFFIINQSANNSDANQRFVQWLSNFTRAWGLLWIRLLMLSAIGVGFSPLVGAPVNFLVMVTMLIAGGVNTKITALYGAQPGEVLDNIALLKSYAAQAIRLLPNFSETNALDYLHNSREILWRDFATQIFRDIFLRGGLIMFLGLWFLSRREIATYRE